MTNSTPEMTRPPKAWMTCILLAITAQAAHAQPASASKAEAERLFKEAQAMRAAGRIGEACELFEGSQRLDASNATIMNLADCRERNGQLASAWALFLEVSSKARDADALVDVARQRARALEPRLSHLIINVPDESRIEGLEITKNGRPVDVATWNRAMPVDGGTYTIAGKAPDHEAWSTTAVVGRENDKQSVDVPKFKSLPVSARRLSAMAGSAEVDAGPMPTVRKVSLGLGAGAIAALGTALAFELSGKSTYEDYDQAPEGADREALYDRANRKHKVAQGLAVAGVAMAGTAVYLWLTGAPERAERADRADRAARLAPAAAPGYAGLSLEGAF